LLELCREHHAALVLVTHDMDLAAQAAKVFRLQDGRLV
jgi:predicted ABC-type transport system involved in lysophospholipase L1 biosynthesis ATPase subunit